MPSETPTDRALLAMERPRTAFLSAVAELVGELGRLLVQDRDPEGGRAQRSAASLGAFGAGRIDASRFAAVLSERPVLPPSALEAIGRARAILSGIVTGGCDPFFVEVGPGEEIVPAVSAALARLGRVFGAARVAALARAGSYRSSEHASLLEELPFARWNRRERELAPPLLVCVDTPRLRLTGLADLLDGGGKIGILAPAAESPAPLALLVTPRVFVAQGGSVEVLERLCANSAPGVAAVLPESAARFVHDPAGGPRLADRLRVEHLPDPSPRPGPDFRGVEERDHLGLLVAAAAVPSGSSVADADASEELRRDPAGVLAAWLLRQASLPGPAGAVAGAA